MYNIYKCRSSVRQFVPTKSLFKRANVEPASKGSKVNIIALKTATFVFRFSYGSSLPMEQLVYLCVARDLINILRSSSNLLGAP